MILLTLSAIAAAAPAPDAATLDPLWTRPAIGLPDALVTADLTGDGRPEVAVGGVNGVATFDPRAPLGDRSLWAVQEASVSAVAATDVTGDGRADVLAGTRHGRVLAYDGADGTPLWNRSTPEGVSALAAAPDTQGTVVAVGDGSGHIALLEGTTGEVRWTTIGRYTASCVTLADVTGDGRPDVVAGVAGMRLYAFDGPTGTKLWEVVTSDGVRQCLTPDLDGDGRADVVALTWGPYVHAVVGATGDALWDRTLPHFAHAGDANGDLTGDGVPDVAVTVRDRSVHLLDGATGATAWSHAFEEQPEPVTVGDVTGDGVPEVVTGDWNHNVTAFDANGQVLWAATGGGEVRNLAIVPLHGAGTSHVLATMGAHAGHRAGVVPGMDPEVPHYDFRVYGFDGDGEKLFDESLFSYAFRLAFADVTGDGVPDVFEGNGDHVVYAWDGATGDFLWRHFMEGFIGELATFDRDDDGRPELAVASDGRVTLLDAVTGEELWRLDVTDPWVHVKGLALGDLDLDGRPDVLAGDYDGVLHGIEAEAGVPLWTYRVPAPVLTIRARDLTGDGFADAVVGLFKAASYEVAAVNGAPLPSPVIDVPPLPAGGSFLPDQVGLGARTLWTYTTGGHVMDLEILDFAVGTGTVPTVVAGSMVYSYNPASPMHSVEGGSAFALHAQTGALRWLVSSLAPVRTVGVADLDGDGNPEVALGDEDGVVTTVDGLGHVRWQVAPQNATWQDAVWAAEGVTLPGREGQGVAVAHWPGRVEVYDGAGGLYATRAVENGIYFIEPQDVDRDGIPELFAGTREGPLYTLKINPLNES